MSLPTLDLKIILLVCILVMTFMFGIFPVLFIKYTAKKVATTPDYLDSRSESVSVINEAELKPPLGNQQLAKYKRYMSLLSCFAAGVFLATCFLELLPDVQRNIIDILTTKSNSFAGFPLAEFVMAMGLFIILVVEQIVLTVKESSFDLPNSRRQTENGYGSTTANSYHPNSYTPIKKLNNSIQTRTTSLHTGSINNSNNNTSFSSLPTDSIESGSNIQTHSPLRAMILVFALSLHSIFEGISVGLLTDNERVLDVFSALIVHKSILSFSLGMNLIQCQISLPSAVKFILGFSVASPIGAVIGILITDVWTSSGGGIVHGILQGIASGTFLYIIFFEILPKEFDNSSDRILKVIFLIVGFAAVTGIIFIGDDVKQPLCKVVNDDG